MAMFLLFIYTYYMADKTFTPMVHADMKVADITNLAPVMSEVMAEYGLHCYSCEIGGTESLREGMDIHGFKPEILEALIEDLNDELTAVPNKPNKLTITKLAAEQLLQISKDQDHNTHNLLITADGQGGFCLEYKDTFSVDEHQFLVDGVPDITFACAPMTYWQIGGSTIDFREGVFKLDVYEPSNCCKNHTNNGSSNGGACSCS